MYARKVSNCCIKGSKSTCKFIKEDKGVQNKKIIGNKYCLFRDQMILC